MQTLIALMIVVLAALYAGWKFMPKTLRSSLARTAAAWVQATGKVSAEDARRLESKLSSGGACGSCDSCNACGTPSAAPKSSGTKENRDDLGVTSKVIPIYKN